MHRLLIAAAKVPAPGIVLGNYPERRNVQPSSSLWLALRALADGPWYHKPRVMAFQRFAARVAQRVDALDGQAQQALRTLTRDLQARLGRDGFVDALLVEAFALVAEIARRELGTAPYQTQLVAARIMLDNQLAEMATGEGKTLAAGIAAAVAALAGVPVHVITANDYLVQRDANTLRPLYRALGLKVGAITQGMDAAARKAAYACELTYCTAKELVFDYLRDRLAEPRGCGPEQAAARLNLPGSSRTLMRGLCMAIIDEADSILIDEARVPLVLSRATPTGPEQTDYRLAWELSARLAPDQHFRIETATRNIHLTASGYEKIQELRAENPTKWLSARHFGDAIKTALVARHVLQPGRDYLVKAGMVLIVDENTGRTADGRAWSRGLHQLVELKESCAPTAHASPLIQMTYQRFFPRYLRLGGMSGTLMEARSELLSIYGLQVTLVPLRRPSRRRDMAASTFRNRPEMWNAAVTRVRTLHAQGRPVLLGTDSVADSEILSRHLNAARLPHALLNARQDQQEAQVIASAGSRAAITIATNMAGRGTDITVNSAIERIGGLHVISCQQNGARRIDRQLMGRCARQGDSGSTEHFISLDGPLLAGQWQSRLAQWLMRLTTLHRGRIGLMALRLRQHAEERHQKLERRMLLRRDTELSRWLAFSGTDA